MKELFSVRPADRRDIPKLAGLFRDTVLRINIRDYTPAQVRAWSARGTEERWEELFGSGLLFFAAEDERRELVGFVSVSLSGHIHSLFVHADRQGCGIARLLLETAEEVARRGGACTCRSEVSVTARGFFEKQGYETVAGQEVVINGERLVNYVMRKRIWEAFAGF